ncbi:hypothetical protein LBMAG53_00800 [Planctomycetota bacterium]|nr:hypothetical protein LBMAG53_00800 [Planctomycetota bacterium]
MSHAPADHANSQAIPADPGKPGQSAVIRTWPRLALAAGLQLPPIAIAVWGQPPWAAVVAGLIGASVCIAATDSRWRWRNRLLVLAAGLWLLWAISPV